MSGEAYAKRYPGGFIDLPEEATAIDSQFLNTVESALMRLLGVDPTDQGVETWDAVLQRFKTILLTNAQIAGNANISRSKLDFGAGLVDADIAPGAAIASSKIGGLSGTAPPTGAMLMYGGATAPGGWLICDGTPISRTVQASLFSVIGIRYGPGDGSTTFNLPDFRGRVPVGVGTHADVGAVGNSDSVAVGSRRPAHKHTITDPGHNHTLNDPGHNHSPAGGATGWVGNGGGSGFQAGNTGLNWPVVGLLSATTGISIQSKTTGVQVGPQTGSEPSDSAAYLVCNVIIKT
jgi:microcystin-dependent protein